MAIAAALVDNPTANEPRKVQQLSFKGKFFVRGAAEVNSPNDRSLHLPGTHTHGSTPHVLPPSEAYLKLELLMPLCFTLGWFSARQRSVACTEATVRWM